MAQETARATEDIARRVDAIQDDTVSAVAAITQISDVIARINDFQATIAAAVEEQTATTGEMNRNVSEAAHGSDSIATSILAVAGAAQETTRAVQDSRNAVDDLSRMAGDLTVVVGKFRV